MPACWQIPLQMDSMTGYARVLNVHRMSSTHDLLQNIACIFMSQLSCTASVPLIIQW